MSSLRHFSVGDRAFPFYDPGDTIAAETLSPMGYEPSVVEILQEDLGPHRSVFCDVGALYGYYGVLASRIDPQVVVHAFEPNDAFAEVAERNLRINRVTGVLHRVALDLEDGQLRFKGRTVASDGDDDVITVEARTFDSYFAQAGIKRALVKIDVHGAEARVLAGMRSSLAGFVDRVIVEVHARHILVGEQTYEDMLSILEEVGFEVSEIVDFRMERRPRLVRLRGDARQSFVDYDRWTAGQISTERMIYARR